MMQGLMRAEGKAMSIAQLCHWFAVPRSTFYYRAERDDPQRSILCWSSWWAG